MSAGTTGASAVSAANPVTFTFTDSSSDLVLVIGIAVNGTAARTGGAPTYNGTALTQAGSTQLVAAGTGRTSSEIWYILAPALPVGTSLTVSIPNSGVNTLRGTASTYRSDAGATTAILGVTGGTTGSSTNPTVTIIPGVTGNAIVSVAGAATTMTVAQTTLGVGTLVAATSFYGNEYEIWPLASSVNLNYTAATGRWSEAVASFFEAPGSAKNGLMRMGIGN